MKHVLNSNGSSLLLPHEREPLLAHADTDLARALSTTPHLEEMRTMLEGHLAGQELEAAWPHNVGVGAVDVDEERNLWLVPHGGHAPILIGHFVDDPPPLEQERAERAVAVSVVASGRTLTEALDEYHRKLNANLQRGLITGIDARLPAVDAMIAAFDAFGESLDRLLVAIVEHEATEHPPTADSSEGSDG